MSTVKFSSTLHAPQQSHYTRTHKTTISGSPHLKLPRIYNKRRRMNDLPSVSQEYTKPKVVLFYKNGDRNYRGSHVTVTPRRFRNFDNLLNELTRITNLAQGARYIFTPDTGTRVDSLDQLSDGRSYVCGSYPKLKKINYNHAPDGKTHENKKRVNRNFIPVPVPSAAKLNVESRTQTTNIKPKVVSIIRNGVGINKKTVKILLNKRTAQSYEQVLDDITAAVGVQGGFVKRLYNVNGKLVQSLTDLFGEDDVFVAVGSEKFKPSLLPKILEESGYEKSRTQSQPPVSSKKEVLPTPPKSSPTRKKKPKPPSVYKQLPKTHAKLPSIPKRSEPDGSDKSQTNEQEASHVDLHEEDIPDNVDESSEPRNSDQDLIDDSRDKNIENSLKTKKESTISSEDSNSDESDSEKETLSAIETNETKSDSSKTSNDSDLHKSLANKSETSNETLENDRKDSNKPPPRTESSANSLSESESTDSKSSVEHKTEIPPKEEKTSDLAIKTNINDMIDKDSEQKLDNDKEVIVYKERMTKVFDSSSEIEKYYDIGKKLGDGNFAIVKQAIDKSNNMTFALKIIEASKMEGKLAMLNNEIKIQRECSHPNIVQLYHDMHSPTQIYLVMELITGGDFFDLISSNVSFEEGEASGYMRDLCSGLDYLHQRQIIHRDIKPENLMVYDVNGRITLKIADFGLAMKVTAPIFTVCGTPTYVAPEILSEKGYGLEVDVWAAGVILYIMLCGFPPFRSANRKQTELFDLIEKGEFEFLEPYWDEVSETAKDLISKILVVDTKARLTANQVFNHSWLSQYGLDRNDTLTGFSPRRSNRFKAAATKVMSVGRFKLLLKKREDFITHVHHDDNKHSEKEKSKEKLTAHSEAEESEHIEGESPNKEEISRECRSDEISVTDEKPYNHMERDDDDKEESPSESTEPNVVSDESDVDTRSEQRKDSSVIASPRSEENENKKDSLDKDVIVSLRSEENENEKDSLDKDTIPSPRSNTKEDESEEDSSVKDKLNDTHE